MKYSINCVLIIVILLNAVVPASGNNDFGSNKFDIIARLKSSEPLRAEKLSLNVVPEKRIISKITFDQSTTFSAYGYSIAIPWTKNIKTMRNDAVSIIYSVSNFLVGVENPKNFDWTNEHYDNLKKNGLVDVFQDKDFPKDTYSLASAALNITYDEFINETHLNFVAQKFYFLSMKLLYVGGKSDHSKVPLHIYSFKTNSLKGYQIGNIERTRLVELYVFCDNNVQLKLNIAKNPEANNSKVNQDHIDFILNSIKKVGSTGS